MCLQLTELRDILIKY